MIKTTIHTVIDEDGEHFAVSPEDAALYSPDRVRAWEFEFERLTPRDILAATTALNNKLGLHIINPLSGERQVGDREAYILSRSVGIVASTLKKWSYNDDKGEVLPINEDNILSLPPSVFYRLVARMDKRTQPRLTPDEEQARKDFLARSTTTGETGE